MILNFTKIIYEISQNVIETIMYKLTTTINLVFPIQ